MACARLSMSSGARLVLRKPRDARTINGVGTRSSAAPQGVRCNSRCASASRPSPRRLPMAGLDSDAALQHAKY